MSIQFIFHPIAIAILLISYYPSVFAQKNNTTKTNAPISKESLHHEPKESEKPPLDFCYRWHNQFLAGKTTEPAKPGDNCIPYQATGGGGSR